MTRGRKPTPKEILELKGSPIRRHRELEKLTGEPSNAEPDVPDVPPLEPPAFLTRSEEIAMFHQVVQALPPGLARKTDVPALARYISWLCIWAAAKRQLDAGEELTYTSKSAHGDLRRASPLLKVLTGAEQRLGILEASMALNIAARHSILSRMFLMPAAPAKDFPLPEDPDSPLGYLLRHQDPKPN